MFANRKQECDFKANNFSLKLCHQIAQFFKGEIKFYFKSKAGTSFMFTFLADNQNTANQTEEVKKNISPDKELDELENIILPVKECQKDIIMAATKARAQNKKFYEVKDSLVSKTSKISLE